MKISQIVACGKRNEIGYQGTMPWHIPADLKYFKELTNKHIVLMGRKTYESIGKPLANRYNLVVSSNQIESAQNTECVANLALAMQRLHELTLEGWPEEVFVIGGASIYEQLLPITQTIYITHINSEFDADTFFPDYGDFVRTQISQTHQHEDLEFYFASWQRPNDGKIKSDTNTDNIRQRRVGYLT